MNQVSMNSKSYMLLVVVVALLAPHTFEIANQYIPDASFTRYSVITLLLTLFYEYGSTLVGPYSTLFIMPPTSTLLLNGLTLVVNLSIILSQWGLINSKISRRVALYIIVIALCVHVLVLIGFFSIQVTGVTSVLAIPLPIFPIVSILAILRNKIPISSS